MVSRRSRIAFAALILAQPRLAFPHTIPDQVTIRMFAKPAGERLHLLVRMPLYALADIVFPSRSKGDLDLPRVDAMLPDAAKTWITDWVDLYAGDALLPKPQVVETRLSLASDPSFASYDEAWAHVTGAGLPDTTELFPARAMFDVLLDYPIRSGQSDLAVHSRLSRLGVTVVTALRFLAP